MSLLQEAVEGKARIQNQLAESEEAKNIFGRVWMNAEVLLTEHGQEAPQGRNDIFGFISNGHQRVVLTEVSVHDKPVSVLIFQGMDNAYVDVRVQYLPNFLRIHKDGRAVMVQHETRNDVTQEYLSVAHLEDARKYQELLGTLKSQLKTSLPVGH